MRNAQPRSAREESALIQEQLAKRFTPEQVNTLWEMEDIARKFAAGEIASDEAVTAFALLESEIAALRHVFCSHLIRGKNSKTSSRDGGR